MGRPTKKGADYVPVDVQMDDDIRLIEAEFGLAGFAVVVKLWQKIYGLNGYYCQFGRDERLLFAKDCAISLELLEDVLQACLSRGIFHAGLHEAYGILTSAGIQKRFFIVIAEKRKDIPVDSRYLLIPKPPNVTLFEENAVNPEKTAVNHELTGVKDGFSATSKGSKGKQSKASKEAEVPRAHEDAPADTEEDRAAATAAADMADFLDPEKAVEDAAMEELRNPALAEAVRRFTGDIRPPNLTEGEHLRDWVQQYPLELVLYAIKEAGGAKPDKRNVRYIDTILRRLQESGVQNAAGLAEYAEKHHARARDHPAQPQGRPVKEVAQHRYAGQRQYSQSELDALVYDPFGEEEPEHERNDGAGERA